MYYFRVRATNSAGDSANSNVASAATQTVITALTAPSNLVADGMSGGVSLHWIDQSSNETGFMIRRSADGGASWSDVGGVSANVSGFSDTSITPGMSYSYYVYAYNTTTQSAISNIASIVPIPVSPTLSAAAQSSNQISLNWSDVNGETSYGVERSMDGVNFSAVGIMSAGLTTYTDSGLNPGTTYSYRVRAYGVSGSQVSNTAVATTATVVTAPAAPSNVASSLINSRTMKITWSDNSANESGFILQYSTDGKTWQSLATLPANTTSYLMSGVKRSTKYYFRVAAYNSIGQSAWA
jgi:titin